MAIHFDGTVSPHNCLCFAFAVACQQRRVALCTVLFLSSDTLTADHRLSVSCENRLACSDTKKICVCLLFILFYVSTQCFHAC